MKQFQAGHRIHLIDHKARHYALTLKVGEVYQHSGGFIRHDDIIGKKDGSVVKLSNGKAMLALYPTLAEYTVKMPRGAQVIYPKDLALIPLWADVYPGARVLEAGIGSGALTIALLRAVGERGQVVSYECREEFARTAMKNIERYLGGPVPNLQLCLENVCEAASLRDEAQHQRFDRVVLDLSEPWQVVPIAAHVLRWGGIYLSFVPTVPQVMQTVEALHQAKTFGLIHTFETLLRTWNIRGRSVRPDHRMVAHSGFITVARKVEKAEWELRGAETTSGTGMDEDFSIATSETEGGEEKSTPSDVESS
ncbi:MAG: tRNA (adenine-N1)-methyltransferase [Nitrospirae bacterium]|nr:MAG: tRNA (adenine-N1)-methyltransferase [Nitrospirota bacterium]